MPTSPSQTSIRLGRQGRLVVPAAIRKALGFRPGENLLARVENDRLIVEKAEAVERRLHTYFRKFEGRSLAEELISERRDEARRESKS